MMVAVGYRCVLLSVFTQILQFFLSPLKTFSTFLLTADVKVKAPAGLLCSQGSARPICLSSETNSELYNRTCYINFHLYESYSMDSYSFEIK